MLDEEEEAAATGEESVNGPAVAWRKSRARIVEVSQSMVQKASTNNDMNISEKILVESASEKDRISEVQLV